eukprot:gene17589-23915_t
MPSLAAALSAVLLKLSWMKALFILNAQLDEGRILNAQLDAGLMSSLAGWRPHASLMLSWMKASCPA